MEYSKIIAVTGLPGLYEVISNKGDGAIVRSLEDRNTRFVSSRVHNFTHLESIEIYTVRDNAMLSDVFNAMKEHKGKLPDAGNSGALRKYFEKVFPDMDFDRVYSSDMKKMVKWFELLQQHGIDFTPAAEEATEEKPGAEAEPEADEPEQIAASAEAKPKRTRRKKEE